MACAKVVDLDTTTKHVFHGEARTKKGFVVGTA